jgi:hypothetical protein
LFIGHSAEIKDGIGFHADSVSELQQAFYETSDMMKQKVTAFLFALFSIYQLCVFRRKETKLYFSQKGQALY